MQAVPRRGRRGRFTPELDKYVAAAQGRRDEADHIGSFLEWLLVEFRVESKERHALRYGRNIRLDLRIFDHPSSGNINKLVSMYFGIDYDQAMDEREALYEHVSQNANLPPMHPQRRTGRKNPA